MPTFLFVLSRERGRIRRVRLWPHTVYPGYEGVDLLVLVVLVRGRVAPTHERGQAALRECECCQGKGPWLFLVQQSRIAH